MIVSALKYTRFSGEPREWHIEGKEANGNDCFAEFGNINLFIGRNASGKSRTLNVIREIAGLVCGQFTVKDALYATERFELKLKNDNDIYYYLLDFKNNSITEEILSVNGNVEFDRRNNIFPSGIVDVDVYVPIICSKNEDGSYLYAKIVGWGRSLKNYLFSNREEKNHPVKSVPVDIHGDDTLLIYTLHRGLEMFGKVFTDDIIACMNDIGYDVSDIGIHEGKSGFSLFVEEEGKYVILQRDLSEGMYRALSLFAKLIFYNLSKASLCVLIDDMGEGLDYERSKALTDILIKKINDSNIQVFMTSNDRQVINKIPLKYLTVIDRKQTNSIFYNYFNSKDVYNDFKYTGLNNFDFLTTDFYLNGFGGNE